MTLRWTRQLTPDDVSILRSLVTLATDTDGVAPLSDDAVLRLTSDPLTTGQHLIVTGSDRPAQPCGIAGYAYLAVHSGDRWQAEVVVHPGQRRRGIAGKLLGALTASADRAGADLAIWAHGDSPAAAALAGSYGFARDRVLWQMRRPLPPASQDVDADETPTPLPEVTVPPDVTVRTFVPGQDEDAWVSVNRRAFADHPEQGQWTIDDLLLRETEPWFDPAGFFLAESAGRLAGFHWTKVHRAADTDAADTDAGDMETRQVDVGEVYVVGVDPTFSGRRLGRALTLIGLHHLRDRGLATVLLYVDDSNQRAVGLYENLGFTRYSCDISYLRAGTDTGT